MTWILIVVLTASGQQMPVNSGRAFASQEACEQAAKAAVSNTQINWVCLPSGEKS